MHAFLILSAVFALANAQRWFVYTCGFIMTGLQHILTLSYGNTQLQIHEVKQNFILPAPAAPSSVPPLPLSRPSWTVSFPDGTRLQAAPSSPAHHCNPPDAVPPVPSRPVPPDAVPPDAHSGPCVCRSNSSPERRRFHKLP